MFARLPRSFAISRSGLLEFARPSIIFHGCTFPGSDIIYKVKTKTKIFHLVLPQYKQISCVAQVRNSYMYTPSPRDLFIHSEILPCGAFPPSIYDTRYRLILYFMSFALGIEKFHDLG